MSLQKSYIRILIRHLLLLVSQLLPSCSQLLVLLRGLLLCCSQFCAQPLVVLVHRLTPALLLQVIMQLLTDGVSCRAIHTMDGLAGCTVCVDTSNALVVAALVECASDNQRSNGCSVTPLRLQT
jgi:hypothetical protein